MVLTVENTLKIGKPCMVYDANGERVHWPISCDTETGEVERYIPTLGSIFADKNGPKTIRESRPAPLQVIWLEEPEASSP